MEQASIFGTLEPLSILFFIVVQIGGRYLKIDLTPAQTTVISRVESAVKSADSSNDSLAPR